MSYHRVAAWLLYLTACVVYWLLFIEHPPTLKEYAVRVIAVLAIAWWIRGLVGLIYNLLRELAAHLGGL